MTDAPGSETEPLNDSTVLAATDVVGEAIFTPEATLGLKTGRLRLFQATAGAVHADTHPAERGVSRSGA